MAIGALFFVTAGIETVVAPLVGREVDRRGALVPVRLALTGRRRVALGLAWAGRPCDRRFVLLAAITSGARSSRRGWPF